MTQVQTPTETEGTSGKQKNSFREADKGGAKTRQAKKKPLSYEAIFRIASQLSQLFAAGITPVSALEILYRDKDNRDLQPILQELYQYVCAGDLLSDAMRRTGVFPAYAVQLTVIGEQTGHLDSVTQSIADFYDDELSLRAAIRSAVSYPIVMILLMFIVVIVLLRYVLPVFRQVYAAAGTTQGGSADFLLAMSDSISHYYVGFLGVFTVLVAAFLFFYAVPAGQQAFRRFLAWFPGTRRLAEEADTGRFAGAMQMTQQAGIDTVEALGLCSEIVENPHVADKVARCRKLLLEGRTLAESLVEVQMFSDFYASMLNVAEESGSVERVMGFISDRCREDTNASINRTIAAIEPTLVIILSVVIGLILLGVIMPLMAVMSSLG